LCEEWKPYIAEFKAAVEPYRATRGNTRSIAWQAFFEKHPQLAQRLGIKPADVRREVSQALSYFYGYHVTGERKLADLARREKERQERQERRASTPDQRAAWRAQKQESNARLAARIRRQKVRTTVKPIVARREDVGLPPLETNGVGLRASLVRTIEQLQSLLKAIE